ncbi:hypothetical protein BZZ01_06145 [Nostocales cyanobacterium HT-58-2]|nr:hypothetical protein BZZ01_06145 [Nostocales cyanobacterium HT-58-2]
MVQTLNVSGTTNYASGASPKVLAPNLSITDPNNGNLNGASVVITSNFNATQDRLGIAGQTGTSGTIQGLNWNYDTTTGVLTLTGTAANDVYQNVLRQVTYSNTNGTPSGGARGIEFALGTNLANPENKHFYDFVPLEGGLSWTNAQALAANSTYFGLQGYLATITSATEQNFIQGKVQGNGWIGGSDAGAEGTWRWVTGPEAGTQFWTGGATGSPFENRYSNWASTEPNNLNNVENYAHVIGNPVLDPSVQGRWNDLADVVGPGPYQPLGYIVEYGGLQGDPAVQLTGNVTLTLNSSKFDFSGDSKPDILWRNYTTDETAIWQLGGTTGTTLERSILLPKPADVRWEIEGQADFTNDGNTDILWRNYRTGENAIWQMNDTNFEKATLLTKVEDTAWKIEGQSDFTGDGNTDILWRNYRTGENGIWRMNGTNLEQATLLTKVDDTAWEIQGLADFTGDGKDEILWRNNRTGENGIWQLNGTTLQQSTLLTPVGDLNWEIEGQADFTGDGKTDILWRNYSTGENAVWEMDGITLKEAKLITKVDDVRWEIEGVGDFTGDGKADILWRNYGSDETAVWRMNGINLDESISLSKTGDTAWEISFPSYFPILT